MIGHLQKVLWNQFGATIDMLKDIVALWPDQFWNLNNKVYYLCYHTFLFLDYYLTVPPTNYAAPLPFKMISQGKVPPYAVDDLLPGRLYTQNELLDCLQSCRQKCKEVIFNLTEENMQRLWIDQPDDIAGSSTLNYSVLEILLYNLKHVQHHTGQLNLLLREETGQAAGWVSSAVDR
jgi:DinB family protein